MNYGRSMKWNIAQTFKSSFFLKKLNVMRDAHYLLIKKFRMKKTYPTYSQLYYPFA